MGNGFLVYIECRDGKIRKGSLEALTTARSLADQLSQTVDAVVVGDDQVVGALKVFGPNRIFRISYDSDIQSRDAWIETLENLIRREEPRYVFATASAMGKDVMPGVSARFNSPVIQEVTEINLDENDLLIKRPIFAGNAFETVKIKTYPSFVTLRPNVFPSSETSGIDSEVIPLQEKIHPDKLKTIIREILQKGGAKVELAEASIVVSGGRGIKEAENYRLIEELAQVLGAAAGASRAVVDAGWIDHQNQVGQTGKTVSPTLYIAVGISGAIQHMAGMSSSKYIVAINKDPDAPIFKAANYGIVGDLFKVVPLLTEQLKTFLQQ